VKRRHSLPLLQSQLPDVYLIDTSAWLNIDGRPDRDDVWRLITNLIAHGRIVTPAQVLGELREDPIFRTRLKAYQAELLAGDHGTDDISYLQLVGRITHDYPSMSGLLERKRLPIHTLSHWPKRKTMLLSQMKAGDARTEKYLASATSEGSGA
jgi:hypothetical protein